MTNLLADRIRKRLEELDLTARGASLKAGLGPDAIRTILNGSSRSPRASTITLLAQALQCDPRYLLGEINIPGRASEEPTSFEKYGGSLVVARSVRAGWWRRSDVARTVSIGTFNRPFFREYSSTSQFGIEIGDDSLLPNILPESILHMVQVWEDVYPYRPTDGDLVLVEKTDMAGALIEETVRYVSARGEGFVLKNRHDEYPYEGEPAEHFASKLQQPSGDYIWITAHAVLAYQPLSSAVPLFERTPERRAPRLGFVRK